MPVAAGRPDLLSCVYLRGSFLEATDMFLMARIPVVRHPEDVEGPIPSGVIQKARLLGEDPVLKLHEDRIVVRAMLDDGQVVEASFHRPKFEREAPTFDELRERVRCGLGSEACFDSDRLRQAVRAFGDDSGVRLVAHGSPTAAIELFGRGGGEALLMPVLWKESRSHVELGEGGA